MEDTLSVIAREETSFMEKFDTRSCSRLSLDSRGNIRIYVNYRYSRKQVVDWIKKNTRRTKIPSEKKAKYVWWLGAKIEQYMQILYETTYSTEEIVTDEDNFYIKRTEFSRLLFYTIRDFNMLLWTSEDGNLPFSFVANWMRLHISFVRFNSDCKGKSLDEKPDGFLFSVRELLGNYLIFNNMLEDI